MKHELGQFYTTNYDYILQSCTIPNNVNEIIEPFAGNGDLLNFINNKKKYTIEAYDIDPKKSFIKKRDTLKNPPDYTNKFILTNPPYLARNKNKNKEIYNLYNCNDLYKCFIKSINVRCLGGIIIVPLNFLTSIRTSDTELRREFLDKFNIIHVNIFEEQVFDDTSYTVCVIQFEQGNTHTFPCHFYPSKKCINVKFYKGIIGGEIYNLPQNDFYTIERATKLTKNKRDITNILIKCIDDTTKINASFSEKYIDNTVNLTARSYLTLVITPNLDEDKQKKLINSFNEFLTEYRNKYNSLFLTNYRENNRKRISFDLVFKIINFLLNNIDD